MPEPTDSNHTGVESYDHSAVKALSEYHEAREALDSLVKAMSREESGIGRAEWLVMVEQIGASLSYSDFSGHPDNGCTEAFKGVWPYRVQLDDDGERDWVRGAYRCSACGAEWQTGYDVNVSDFI